MNPLHIAGTCIILLLIASCGEETETRVQGLIGIFGTVEGPSFTITTAERNDTRFDATGVTLRNQGTGPFDDDLIATIDTSQLVDGLRTIRLDVTDGTIITSDYLYIESDNIKISTRYNPTSRLIAVEGTLPAHISQYTITYNHNTVPLPHIPEAITITNNRIGLLGMIDVGRIGYAGTYIITLATTHPTGRIVIETIPTEVKDQSLVQPPDITASRIINTGSAVAKGTVHLTLSTISTVATVGPICPPNCEPTCPTDCQTSRCGDSICHPPERGSCTLDCGTLDTGALGILPDQSYRRTPLAQINASRTLLPNSPLPLAPLFTNQSLDKPGFYSIDASFETGGVTTTYATWNFRVANTTLPTASLPCRDGTSRGTCSKSPPLLCRLDTPDLVQNCRSCGCPTGEACQSNGSCQVARCDDGTLYGTCSADKPILCAEGHLISDCDTCGCQNGKACIQGHCIEEIIEVDVGPRRFSANESQQILLQLSGTRSITTVNFSARLTKPGLTLPMLINAQDPADVQCYEPTNCERYYYLYANATLRPDGMINVGPPIPPGQYVLELYNISPALHLNATNFSIESRDIDLATFVTLGNISSDNRVRFTLHSARYEGFLYNQFGPTIDHIDAYYNPIPDNVDYIIEVEILSDITPGIIDTYQLLGNELRLVGSQVITVETVGFTEVVSGGRVIEQPALMRYTWTSGGAIIIVSTRVETNITPVLNHYLARYPSDLREGTEPYRIRFNRGWNLISTPLIPNVKNLTTLTAHLRATGLRLFEYIPSTNSWKIFHIDPNIPSNLHTLDEGKGYYLFANAPGEIHIVGSRGLNIQGQPEIPPTFQLHKGWNLISLHSIRATSATEAYRSILPTINSLWTLEDGKLIKLTIDDATLEPSNAYWINLKQNETLVS
ncbi:hypothetical protein HY641_02825 [Candidatus Woesearchaeota archaeon]|nr:hypothetical protein [Candidatus Woesearchaeota archaeon]